MEIKKGINQESIQEMNRSLVIRLLRERESCSRAELARISKLRPSTITNIISEFQQYGLVKEAGTISEGRGRNAIEVSINAERFQVVGVRLSRKYFQTGLFNMKGQEITSCEKTISKGETPKAVFQRIKEEIRKLFEGCEGGRVRAIGFAVPGPFVRKEGRVALMSGFSGWQNVKIKQELEEAFHVPAYLEHDANVGAIAQYWKLCPGENKTLVYIAAGQGIGAGIVNEGELFLGALGAAGEIGHMSIDYQGPYCVCGNKGCLEIYCSSTAFAKNVEKRITEGNYSMMEKGGGFVEAAEAARKGDNLVLEEYRKACRILGTGVVNLVNLLNPDIIVIGDEMARVHPKIMAETVKEIVRASVIQDIWKNMDIKICEKDRDMILAGASLIAIEEELKRPQLIIESE